MVYTENCNAIFSIERDVKRPSHVRRGATVRTVKFRGLAQLVERAVRDRAMQMSDIVAFEDFSEHFFSCRLRFGEAPCGENDEVTFGMR